MHPMRAGAFVKIIHVLGTEIKPIAHLLLDVCQCTMARIGLSAERIPAAHGVEVPNQLRIFIPGFRRGHLFHAVAIP
jgi:hypothetical protein